MKILIIGDSHTGALNRGLVALKNSDQLPRDVHIVIRPLGGGHLLPTTFFRDAGDHAEILADEYRKAFRQLPPKGSSYDAIGLSMPLWPMRVIHGMVWGKHALAERINQRRPISNAVFRELVLADQKYVLALADLLQRLGLKVFAVSPPGLFRDHNTLKFIPPAHGLTMFETYRTIMRDALHKHGVDIVDIPAPCLDDEGFMRPEYRHELPQDEHHANAEFGSLMIQSVADWARSA